MGGLLLLQCVQSNNKPSIWGWFDSHPQDLPSYQRLRGRGRGTTLGTHRGRCRVRRRAPRRGSCRYVADARLGAGESWKCLGQKS